MAVGAEGAASKLVLARSFREAELELGGPRAMGSLDSGACMVESVWLFGRSRERKGERGCAVAEGEAGTESSGSESR